MYFLKYFMAVIEYPMSKQGPRNDFYQNKILKKYDNLRFFKFLLNKSPIPYPVPRPLLIQCIYLENNNKKQNSASNFHFESSHNHTHTTKLAQKINYYKHGCEKPTTSPRYIHILSLFIPLRPHSYAILEKC